MINRKYKDTVFRDLFGAPERRENTLELFNALTGNNYTDPQIIELTTIENALYMSVKNDVSLLVDADMMLWENQSTYNPNMPIRGLMYFAQLYSAWIAKHDKNVFSSKRIELSTPHYYVFYVGEDSRPEREIFRLSDAFHGSEGDVEVVATVLNINVGKNKKLAESCSALAGYTKLIALVRNNTKSGMNLEEAVSVAVDTCIKDGILEEYLRLKKAEVSEMLLTEYDEAKTMQLFKAEGREEEREKLLEAVASMLRDETLTLQSAIKYFDLTDSEIQILSSKDC